MFTAKYVVLSQIDAIFLQHRSGSILHRIALGLIWSNLILYASLSVVFACACIPREKIWNPHMDGRCINSNDGLIASSAINVVSDLSILVFPLVTIWKLVIPLKSKLRVARFNILHVNGYRQERRLIRPCA
jgi:hypothetical protein